MPQHAGLLFHKDTGRWHPILFREAPKPSEHGEPYCRHHSVGNHTKGFETEEQALGFIAQQEGWVYQGLAWEWSGDETPAMSPTLPVLRD